MHMICSPSLLHWHILVNVIRSGGSSGAYVRSAKGISAYGGTGWLDNVRAKVGAMASLLLSFMIHPAARLEGGRTAPQAPLTRTKIQEFSGLVPGTRTSVSSSESSIDDGSRLLRYPFPVIRRSPSAILLNLKVRISPSPLAGLVCRS